MGFILGKAIMPITTTDYDYSQFYVTVNGRTDIMFTVMACNDAHIALSTIPGNFDTMTMEFVIGGWYNTRSAIRQCKQCASEVEVETQNILSCTEHRAFWIRWKDGLYQVQSLLK